MRHAERHGGLQRHGPVLVLLLCLIAAFASAFPANVVSESVGPVTPRFDTALSMLSAAHNAADAASNVACATLTDCNTCYNTTGCHFCENDMKCHTIGSIWGCVYGLSCPGEDPCFRAEPTFEGYTSSPSYVYIVISLLGIATFAVIVTGLYCALIGCCRSSDSLVDADDGISPLAPAAAGDSSDYYELGTPVPRPAATVATGGSLGSLNSDDRLGERWLQPAPVVAAADARGLLGMRALPAPNATAATAAAAAQDPTLPPFMRARLQRDADAAERAAREAAAPGSNSINSSGGGSGGRRESTTERLEASALDCCYTACCCLCLCGHRGGGVRGACSTLGRWARGVCACKPHAIFSLLTVVIGVVVMTAAIIAMVFFPQNPGYSLCNKQIHWGSILSSLTQFEVAINATLHFALHNPNRFDLNVNHLTCYVKYKGSHVAVASVAGSGSAGGEDNGNGNGSALRALAPVSTPLPALAPLSAAHAASMLSTMFPGARAGPVYAVSQSADVEGSGGNHAVTASGDRTKLPAGSVADVRIIAKVDPTSDVATAMAVDYALGSLFVDIELFIDTSVAMWDRDLARVNTSYVWDKMDVNGPPDRHLCKCG